MRRILLLLGGIALSLGPRPAMAQAGTERTPVQLQAAAELRLLSLEAREAARPTRPVPVAAARDYRWEGLLLGAAVVGLTGALLMHGTCEANESCTGPTVSGLALGAGVGGVVGGLVGANISKGQE